MNYSDMIEELNVVMGTYAILEWAEEKLNRQAHQIVTQDEFWEVAREHSAMPNFSDIYQSCLGKNLPSLMSDRIKDSESFAEFLFEYIIDEYDEEPELIDGELSDFAVIQAVWDFVNDEDEGGDISELLNTVVEKLNETKPNFEQHVEADINDVATSFHINGTAIGDSDQIDECIVETLVEHYDYKFELAQLLRDDERYTQCLENAKKEIKQVATQALSGPR